MSAATCMRGHPRTPQNNTRRTPGKYDCRRCAEIRRQLKARGLSGYVDPAPAQAKVRALRAAGMSREEIAARAGLTTTVIRELTYGERPRIAAATARAIAGVRLTVGDRVRISPVGVRRRLEALQAVGWSLTAVANRCGVPVDMLWRISRGVHARCAAKTLEQVRVAYDELWDQQPTGTWVGRTKRRAQQLGYAPPLAWDDDSIDDPNAKPQHKITGPRREHVDPIAVATRRPTTSTERAAVVDELTMQGLSAAQIAMMIDAAKRTVEHARSRRAEQREAA